MFLVFARGSALRLGVCLLGFLAVVCAVTPVPTIASLCTQPKGTRQDGELAHERGPTTQNRSTRARLKVASNGNAHQSANTKQHPAPNSRKRNRTRSMRRHPDTRERSNRSNASTATKEASGARKPTRPPVAAADPGGTPATQHVLSPTARELRDQTQSPQLVTGRTSSVSSRTASFSPMSQ